MDRPTQTVSGETQQTVAIPEAPPPSKPSTISHHSQIHDEGRFIAGTLLAGRYRIVGLLGKGGMGEVYRATDLALGQSVALKFLPPSAAANPQLLERFHGEVRVARQVSHPNVCRVYDIGEVDGMPFISMEYVDGEDLASLLTRIGRLPADKAVDTARRICAGLAAAHSKGVIHRDLKPQNIMMNRRGEIVIMDFGLAAIADQLSGPEARNGTPAYMSPEQLKGTEVTARSDIFALGLVIFELFTGKRPYEAKNARQLISLQEAAQLPSMTTLAGDINPTVDRIIRRCLDPDPARRPETPLAVSAALPGGDPLAAALAAGETPSPELIAASGETAGIARSTAIACLAIAILGVVAMPIFRQQGTAFYQTPIDNPPDVLKHKAREAAASFGYTRRPADQWLRLNQRLSLIAWLSARPAPQNWPAWLRLEGPVLAAYRESPSPIVARPKGIVQYDRPAVSEPGMVSLDMDNNGHLRTFSAVPDQPVDPPVPPETVFRAAGFDFSGFTEVTPKSLPSQPSDRIRAWQGQRTGIPGLNATIQIAWWKGQITDVKFVWPWTNDNPSQRNPTILLIRSLLDPALGGSLIFFAALLARRNWHRKSGDRHGAAVIGAAAFLLMLIQWLGETHFVASPASSAALFDAVEEAFFRGSVLALIYLAAEPFLRARWPHALITWSRLLAGRWRDPQVAAHILFGAAGGTIVLLAVEAQQLLRHNMSTTGGLYLLNGTLQWIGGMASRLLDGQAGLLIFFLIFGLRTALRRDWAAAFVGALLFTLLQGDLVTSTNLAVEIPVYLVTYGAMIFILLRLGLLVTVSAVFTLNLVNGITLGTDWTGWNVPTGVATAVLALAFYLWAFRQSLGSGGLLSAAEVAAE